MTSAASRLGELAVGPDVEGLRGLVRRLRGQRVRAVIESMTGARFVHDTLEQHGWEVLVADAQKVKGPGVVGVQDRPHRRAGGSCRGAIWCRRFWLADPSVRRERELACFGLHLVRRRTTLKNRIHATLMTFGHPCPVSDLFGLSGRGLLDKMAIPDPWRSNVEVSLRVIDDLELEIAS